MNAFFKSVSVCLGLFFFLGDSASFAQLSFEYRYFRADNPLAIITGDFNNDTYLDLAIGDEYVVSSGNFQQQVLLNNGSGYFTWTLSSLVATAVHYDLVAGHFNADDTLDLVMPKAAFAFPGTHTVMPMRGNGNGTFSFLGNFYPTNTQNPCRITSADYDEDGFLDVAVSGCESANIAILFGDGNLGFSSPDTFHVGSKPRGIISDDFNIDGNIDLAVAISGDDSIAIFLGNGDGTFDIPPFKYAVADSPIALVSDFFNDDSYPDIAVANFNSNDVSVLIGLGTGEFIYPSSPFPFPVGTNPIAITTGDFDMDNQIDLAVANMGSDDITLLFGPDGNFYYTEIFSVPEGPRDIVSGEFSGDSKLDLAIVCYPGPGVLDTICVLINNTDPTGVDDIPTAFRASLSQNYPNPFNPITFITYEINKDCAVSLAVFNVKGQLVRSLVNEKQVPGKYSMPWDGKDNRGYDLPSGIYFYQLTTENIKLSKKGVLLR